MTTSSTPAVAQTLVRLCREGKFDQAMRELYSNDITSVEGFDMNGMSRVCKGMEAIKAKSQWWSANHEIHSVSVSDPFMALDKFAVIFEMDVTFKPEAKRLKMKEVAVYTVANGKIVHEEFLYAE